VKQKVRHKKASNIYAGDGRGRGKRGFVNSLKKLADMQSTL
jgi:hypothetical protein